MSSCQRANEVQCCDTVSFDLLTQKPSMGLSHPGGARSTYNRLASSPFQSPRTHRFHNRATASETGKAVLNWCVSIDSLRQQTVAATLQAILKVQ
jgi:hypothetical protein